jgi:DNA-binding NarL/FixJ family response regulator
MRRMIGTALNACYDRSVKPGKRALLLVSHPWLQQTLRELLTNSGLNVMEEPADAMEGVYLAVQQQPDVVVVDTTLEHMNGSMLGQLIHKLVPQTRVILLVDDSWDYNQLAEDQRVAACISKRTAAQEMPPLIQQLLAG